MKTLKNYNLWLVVAAVLLLTIQVLGFVIYICSFVPLHWDDSFLEGLEPTRDTLFYAVFLGASVVLMAAGIQWLLPRLNTQENCRKFHLWLWLEVLWSFLMVFCLFKWTTYKYPFWNILPYENHSWLAPFFWGVGGLSLLSKIFFPEVDKFYGRLKNSGERIAHWYVVPLQFLFIVAIIGLLYIPNPKDVVALALGWDQWNHLDYVTGWFVKHGWYISYEQTVQFLVASAVVYVIAVFYFIRRWLKSWLLAALGAVLVIKFGLFYYTAAPCIWVNPSNTFLAHGWDIILFFGLWFMGVKYPKWFYAVSALLGLLLVWTWVRSQGYIDGMGLDNQPMFAPLRVRQFFPFFMGYFVPLFYTLSLLMLIGQRAAGFPIILCVYGLMIFTAYIEHPAIGFYGSLMVPAVLIMLYWLNQLFLSASAFIKRQAYTILLLLAVGALLTNRLMLTYPNILFEDNSRFARERAFYEQVNAVAKSAALIRRLTTENQKVVLVSNFETALLMQAQRQPLGEDFPTMFSSFANGPGNLALVTKKQVLDLVDSMQKENADYAFVDARLWALSPEALGNTGLAVVLKFLNTHYTLYQQQGFLVALQRRS
jgi:hypothetical protein